jgi:spore coat polysaccharide biosynthesis protein SpsF (cytidylyltransferase family)
VKSSKYELKPSDREHVTLLLKNHIDFRKKEFNPRRPLNEDYNKVRITVDYEEDLKAIELLVDELGFNASWLDYSNYYLENIELMGNSSIKRNEGLIKSLKNDKKS